MPDGPPKPDYVAHVRQSVAEELYRVLHLGWTMMRIVQTKTYEQSRSLDAFIAEHLPVCKADAYSAGSAWAAVTALLKANGQPVDQSDDWEACRAVVGTVLPELTTEEALVCFRPVIERAVPLMLAVWNRAVELSELTKTKQLTARHVKTATDELLPMPTKAARSQPTPTEDVSRETEESGAELSDRAVGHLTRQVRDVCENLPLIPEVATAIIEGAAIRQIANEVGSAKDHLEKIVDKEICSQLEVGKLMVLLAEAKRKLMFGKPYAPCPHCWQVGRTTENCDGCRPSLDSKPLGWVNKSKWGSAPKQKWGGPA